ncbi:MAG: DegV family protein [Anaerolineae bacterium]|nr:DegV family protein [Anaerolineae bacterium]MDW8102121.1 DegV family protein [Anaerolineae bacterium]
MVGILTDSSFNLPREIIEELEIEVIPLYVQIDTETYEEFDITTAELCRKMREGVLPQTSQPPVGKFEEIFRKMAQKYDSIIAILITSKHSGTYNSAMVARAMLPELDIEVVDSLSIASGTGFMAEAAARAARKGKTKEEILNIIYKLRDKINLVATVSTLKYLHASGRVGAVKTMMASLLDVKPILSLKEGEVVVIGQTRTRARSLEQIISHVSKAAESLKPVDLAVLHADCFEEALMLKEELIKRVNPNRIFVAEITSVLAAHGGPGLIGVVYSPAITQV